jgi:Family of unknown function (DUF5309)
MAILSGIFNTNGFNPAELNTRSFAGTMLRLFPNGSAPLFALSSQSGKSRAKSSTHGYFSKTLTFVKTTSTSGDLVGATTLTVGDTTGMAAGAVLYNTRTRENMRVTSITSSTQVVVTRAFGRVAAAAINAADNIIQIGTAFAEGSTRPAARSLEIVYVPNYTQIFRNAWGLTDTARASMAEMGHSNVAENRKDCSLFHSIDAESAIIWGQPKMDTSGTQPVHATQGIIDAMEQYAAANTNAAASTTTFDQLVALVEPAFAYSTDMGNPRMRFGICDSVGMKVLHQIALKYGSVELNQMETSFGMRFERFKFYKGEINLVEHPLMNGLSTSTTAGNLIVIDLPALKLAYMDGRDTVAEEYGSGGKMVENGTDGVGGSLTSEFAVELINPFGCAWVSNLTAAA